MCLFIDCHFLFKFNCCAWIYILKFCHLKIVSGAMDARKWSVKWRNWNISDTFFSLSSIERRKQWRRPETFASCFFFKVQMLCLNVHIEVLSFEDSEWSRGKWSAKWRNWNISDIFFSLSSIEGRKHRSSTIPFFSL